jgi:F0F1-type ATP synthase delta subunit
MSKLPRHELAIVLAERLRTVPEKRLASEVAAYLLSEGRSGELDSLLRDIRQYRAEYGVVEVVAVSAHELNAQTRRDVESQVRGLYPGAKHIIISPRLDVDVIGGVRLELANQQLDLTVRGKLNRFKQLTETGA